MGTKKGQVRKTARRAYEPRKWSAPGSTDKRRARKKRRFEMRFGEIFGNRLAGRLLKKWF